MNHFPTSITDLFPFLGGWQVLASSCRSFCECLYQQRQEMARHGETARVSRGALFLVAWRGDLFPANDEKPPCGW